MKRGNIESHDEAISHVLENRCALVLELFSLRLMTFLLSNRILWIRPLFVNLRIFSTSRKIISARQYLDIFRRKYSMHICKGTNPFCGLTDRPEYHPLAFSDIFYCSDLKPQDVERVVGFLKLQSTSPLLRGSNLNGQTLALVRMIARLYNVHT